MAASFYEASVSEESERHLQQGDVLHPVPFVGFSVTEVTILAPDAEEPDTVDLTQNADLAPETKLFANVGMSTGIVLNQSCDLSDRPNKGRPILVARVASPGEKGIKISSDKSVKNNVDAIKSLANPGRRPSYFYLPEYESTNFKMPRSIVDLLEVTSFPPSNHMALSSLVRLRLSNDALQALQERLATGAHSRHRIPPSALSLKVTSTPRFWVPSGRTHVSRVAICLSQEAHCSGSCLMGRYGSSSAQILGYPAYSPRRISIRRHHIRYGEICL